MSESTDIMKIDMRIENGFFVADWDAMELAARKYVEKFDGMEIVTEDDRKAAKKIRAELKSKITDIERARVDLGKSYDAPKFAFNDQCRKLTGIISDQINHIDKRLKEMDEAFAVDRRNALEREYEGVAPDLMALIPLDAFIGKNPKLMGRSIVETKACKTLDNMIVQAVEDRETIRNSGLQYADECDRMYCETLDLKRAISRNSELIEAERARAAHAVKSEAVDRAVHSAPVVKPIPRQNARLGDELKGEPELTDWRFDFTASRAVAEQIARYARSLGVVSDGIRRRR